MKFVFTRLIVYQLECVSVCVCVYLGGLGMLPPTLDSQTVRVPNCSAHTTLFVCESVCLFAAVTGHNLASLFELELTVREWKSAGRDARHNKQHAFL